MTDIRRASAADPILAPWRRRRAAVAAFGELEAKRSRDRIGVSQTKPEPLSHAVGLAALVADESTRGLVVAKIFAAEVLGEDEAVTAEVLHGREEAERLDAGDPAIDQLPDLVRKKGGDIFLILRRPPRSTRAV